MQQINNLKDLSLTERLISVPKCLWEQEILPVLEEHNLYIPNNYDPNKINYNKFLNKLEIPALRKILYSSFYKSSSNFKMKFVGLMLQRIWGIQVLEMEDQYIFAIEESKKTQAAEFFKFVAKLEPETAQVIKSETVI